MAKKYGIYTVILVAGICLGYIFFGNNNANETTHSHEETTVKEVWTCSMHPQIVKETSGACPLCAMDLVKSEGGNNLPSENQFTMSEDALALANVQTTVVGMSKNSNENLSLSGKITANDKTNAIQTTLYDGRIDKLNVNYVGERVYKGQEIGLIYSPELYLAQDKLLTSASFKETHEKLYQAARNSLGLWKMTDEQIDEVLKTGTPMVNFPIYGDVSGTVTEIIAAAGNYYKQGDALYKVANLNTVWAVFDVYENQLASLKVGQEIEITSNALKGKSFKAKVNFIEPFLNNLKRTVSLRATLNNSKGLFKPGMFVKGVVGVGGDNHLLTIPKSAVMWTGKRSLVYVKPFLDQYVFEMREVTLGSEMDDIYVVLEGLADGEVIVTNGTFTLDAAAQLQGKKSMMTAVKTKDSQMPSMDDKNSVADLNPNISKEFVESLDIYIELKNALIASDFENAQSKSRVLHQKIVKLELDFTNEATQQMFKAIAKNAREISTAADVEAQRKYFKPLSEDMVGITSVLNTLGKTVYVQFCPMADGNKGASWLSFESEVRNPYFGEVMLKCGSVKATLN
ncbi:efflux RND transporter periplasmic adaptor subunit [Spongiimicrobium sp. 3-5]|uniref:efflux RND transporter periplasmic adaptor subunit n=1 Tax=Spongiimicrobium sp. 3-5 TaxID=3332596 RepID=UPI0039804D31